MLYGRERESAAVDRLLADARDGRSGVLVVRGEAGLGKSALLDHAAQCCTDVPVLRGVGIESEAELPFAGLHLLLRGYLGHLDGLPPLQARALRGALGIGPAPGDDRFFSAGFVKTLGAVEILGAIGLILPAVLDIAPVLAPLAALGLGLIMIGAPIVEFRRHELKHVLLDLTYLALIVFVAVGRFGSESFTS